MGGPGLTRTDPDRSEQTQTHPDGPGRTWTDPDRPRRTWTNPDGLELISFAVLSNI